MIKFKDIKLEKEVIKAVNILGYKNLTEVQEKTFSHITNGEDLLVKSETGSGKTLSFVIPTINQIKWEERSPQVLVIVPTRELAIQVGEEFFNIGRFKRIKVATIFGKSPYRRQERELKERVHVVVGTPGRLLDHLQRGNLKLDKVKYLVLDEADEMLDMGFLDEVDAILKQIPENRVSLLFSATLKNDLEDLKNKYMKNPKYIEVESKDDSLSRIDQFFYKSEMKDMGILNNILISESPESAIIFANTRKEVDNIYNNFSRLGYPVNKIHGAMEQDDRSEVMNSFKMKEFRYLIATDVAARGIDVDDISHVINWGLPREREDYIHRIGRTGRKGKKGRAITIYNKKEETTLKTIESELSIKFHEYKMPDELKLKNLEEEFLLKMDEDLEKLEKKSDILSYDILKLHINAGKKTKMRAGDIVGAICSIEGVTAEDIGIINIIPVSSFVEILNGKGQLVYRELQTKKIKGRVRNISIARR